MQSTLTRSTIVWFVVAGVSGAASVFLHLFRSALGGGNTALLLANAAKAATALAVVTVNRRVL